MSKKLTYIDSEGIEQPLELFEVAKDQTTDSVVDVDVDIPYVTKKDIEKALFIDPTNGYEFVNMGEAGIWAKYPIGVSEWNEESLDNIKYFAWGETEGYTASQVGVDKQFNSDWSDYKWGDAWNQLTKYCSKSNFGKNGFTDELTVLLPEDDACTVNMGGNWRMPTMEEFRTLYILCKTEWVTDYNGVSGLNGMVFKLRTDESKQLFFPASGSCVDGSVNNVGSYGHFYSSLSVLNPCNGFELAFHSAYISVEGGNNRYYGLPVVGLLGSNDKLEKYLTKKEAKETYDKPINDILEKLEEHNDKLEGVTKAADDSEVIKSIRTYNGAIVATPAGGDINIGFGDVIAENTDTAGIGGNNNFRLIVNPSGKIATKDDLSNLKSDILGDDLESTFDTLKEVQDWADEHGTEYAELVKEVGKKADKDKTINSILINDKETLLPNSSNRVGLNFGKGFKSVGNSENKATVNLDEEYVAIKDDLNDVNAKKLSGHTIYNITPYDFYSVGLQGLSIKLNILESVASASIFVKIEGITYGGNHNTEFTPYNTSIQFWKSNNQFGRAKAVNNGNDFINEVKVFTKDGYVWLWLKGQDHFERLKITAYINESKDNIVIGCVNEEFPEEDATNVSNIPIVNSATTDDLNEVVYAKEVADSSTVEDIEKYTIDDIKKALFIDMWKSLYRGCDYNPETKNFIVHFYKESENTIPVYTIDDITYEEALVIYRFGTYSSSKDVFRGSFSSRNKCPQVRVILPLCPDVQFETYPYYNWLPYSIEVIHCFQVSSYTNSDAHDINGNFGASASNLKHVFDKIRPTKDNYDVGDMPKLETIYLYGITLNVNISKCPLVSLESFTYMVQYAKNTSAITITVHPDVYAKLTDEQNTEWYELNQTAKEKQITFATA